MQLTFRSSVNQWECDENQHLNVRYYVDKHVQTLSAGLDPQRRGAWLHAAIRTQHLRFQQEARLATPITGCVTAVAGSDGNACYLTELRHAVDGTVLSTCLTEVDGVDARLPQDLPDYAAPRGLATSDCPYQTIPLAEIESYGFQCIGAGIVTQGEIDAKGRLTPMHYMGRLSDSMPHLWAYLLDGEYHSEEEGGAVLEYRMDYRGHLCEGDRWVIYSGLLTTARKAQQFQHLVFNPDSARLVMACNAIGVRMDLKARSAVVFDDNRAAGLKARLLRSADFQKGAD